MSISMKRRQFLTDLVASAADLPVPLVKREDYKPGQEFGESIDVDGRLPKEEERLVLHLMAEAAKRNLPPGTAFQIRLSLPRHFGQVRSVAWVGLGNEPDPEGDWGVARWLRTSFEEAEEGGEQRLGGRGPLMGYFKAGEGTA